MPSQALTISKCKTVLLSQIGKEDIRLTGQPVAVNQLLELQLVLRLHHSQNLLMLLLLLSSSTADAM
jgi:hypothetical protein